MITVEGIEVEEQPRLVVERESLTKSAAQLRSVEFTGGQTFKPPPHEIADNLGPWQLGDAEFPECLSH